MKKIALSLLATMAMGSLSFAEEDTVSSIIEEGDNSHFYAGVGITYNRVYSDEYDWFDDNKLTQDEVGGVSLVLGYEYNENIAIEGRIVKSFMEEDYADLTIYSLFLKPQYPITEEFKIYGLLGFGNVNVEGTNGDVPAASEVISHRILNESSFQWGFGISYAIMEGAELFLDFTESISDGDIDSRLYNYDPLTYDKLTVDGITFGIMYQF